MKITLIHPSRGRAEKAKETAKYWLDKASGKNEIQYVLSIDFDDPEKEKYMTASWRDFLGSRDFRLICDYHSSVVEATNDGVKLATGEILIYLSDDFLCPDNWDEEILNELDFHTNKSKEWLLKVDDCLQPYSADVLTIPIMSMDLYKRLGYFWNPEYKSMFVDQDLYYVVKNNGWMLHASNLKFKHMHHCTGLAPKDKTYTDSEAHWNTGQAIFNRRKREGFPL